MIGVPAYSAFFFDHLFDLFTGPALLVDFVFEKLIVGFCNVIGGKFELVEGRGFDAER